MKPIARQTLWALSISGLLTGPVEASMNHPYAMDSPHFRLLMESTIHTDPPEGIDPAIRAWLERTAKSLEAKIAGLGLEPYAEAPQGALSFAEFDRSERVEARSAYAACLLKAARSRGEGYSADVRFKAAGRFFNVEYRFVVRPEGAGQDWFLNLEARVSGRPDRAKLAGLRNRLRKELGARSEASDRNNGRMYEGGPPRHAPSPTTVLAVDDEASSDGGATFETSRVRIHAEAAFPAERAKTLLKKLDTDVSAGETGAPAPAARPFLFQIHGPKEVFVLAQIELKTVEAEEAGSAPFEAVVGHVLALIRSVIPELKGSGAEDLDPKKDLWLQP